MNKERLKGEIGKNLKAARIHEGLTQEKLAEKIERSASFISRIENGTSLPGLENLANIAEKLEIRLERLTSVSVDYVVQEEEEDRHLQFLISTCTKDEKKHLVEYINLLKKYPNQK